MSHYGPGRDWVRRCVAVCGRPIIGQSARSAKHSVVVVLEQFIKNGAKTISIDQEFIHAEDGNIISDGEAAEDQPERE